MADYIQVPPDSTGKRIATKQHTEDGVPVQVQRFHLVSGDDPTSDMRVDERGSAFMRFAEGQPIMDAYKNFKTVQTSIVGVYEHSNSAYDDLFAIETVGAGASTYDADQACVVLSVGDDAGDSVRRTSNRYHYYQPGRSLLVFVGVSFGDHGKPGCTRRAGYYDDNNGYFLEMKDETINLVWRTNVSGEIVEERVAQANWNGDKLDGTGLSGHIYDPNQLYSFWFDIRFPTGHSRVGIYDPSGERVTMHTFTHVGSSPLPNLGAPSLPLRWEIFNTSVTGSSSEMREVIGAVLSEGSTDYTFWRYGGMGCTQKTVDQPNTPLFSVRPKLVLPSGKANHINVYPETLSVYSSGSGGGAKIELVFHTSPFHLLTGDTWSIDNGSTLETDNVATAINTESDDYWIEKTFYVSPGVSNIDLTPFFEINDEGILLGGDGANQSILSFVATPLDGTCVLTCDLSTRELW